MPATIIDGKAIAADRRQKLVPRIQKIKAAGAPVRLDALIAGAGDTASRVYADNQRATCESLGIDYRLHELDADATYDDIAGRVLLLNSKDEVGAIMVHLPLPAGVDPYDIQRLIDPEKDVEGVNPANIGNVVYGRAGYAPCTALAAMALIEHTEANLRGKLAVVVGASNVVGKPLAVLLMRRDATVISSNKWTPDLPSLARRADVLVAAAGVPGLVTPEWVKEGAIVIDVGVNRIEDVGGKRKTVGDVAFNEVREKAGHISPVPGGVGPMTVAVLLENVVEAAELRATVG